MSAGQVSRRAVPRVALLWRGQPKTHARLQNLFSALSSSGIDAEWVVYTEETHDRVRDAILRCDGTLVWVDPISDGRDRTALDALLREASDQGVWVSAHPDVIQKMGTKEVLYTTRHLGWVSDVGFYRTAAQLMEEFPARLRAYGLRVLKQRRGNGGIGTWKVAVPSGAADITGETRLRVDEARPGAATEELRLTELLRRLRSHLSPAGLIDQPFEPRAAEGMIRCYLVQDRVIGFGRQEPRGDGSFGHAREKTMYPASHPVLSGLKDRMEQQWVPGMQRLLAIDATSLPVIWDADFLLGSKTVAGEDTHVLCEINVSSVSPFPQFAAADIARAVAARLLPTEDAQSHE